MATHDGTIVTATVLAELAAAGREQPLLPARDNIAKAYLGQWGGKDTVEKTRARLHWMAGCAVGQRVLDVGCSEGMLAILLAREGFEVTGVDINDQAIAFAQELLAREAPEVRQRVRFVAANVTTLDPPSERYDCLILGEVIEHVLNPELFLERCLAHLRPGGRLILTTPFGLLPHHDHKQTFFLSDLLALLQPALQVLHLSVADGYIRCVAELLDGDQPRTSAAPPAPEHLRTPWLAAALQETERAILAFQQRHFRDREAVRRRVKQLSANVERLRRQKASTTETDKLCAQLEQLSAELARVSAERDSLLNRQRAERQASIEPESAELQQSSAAVHEALRLLYEQRAVTEARRHTPTSILRIAPVGQNVRLPDEPLWLTAVVEGGARYELGGNLYGSRATMPRAALLRVMFYDAAGHVLPPPYDGIANSPSTGPYTYLKAGDDSGKFCWRFRTPVEAASVLLGFQVWGARQRGPEEDQFETASGSIGPLALAPELRLTLLMPPQRPLELRVEAQPTVSDGALLEGLANAISLDRQPIYAEASVSADTEYEVCGQLFTDPRDDYRAALLIIECYDANGDSVPLPEIPGTLQHGNIGAFMYVRREPDSPCFALPLKTPPSAARLRIGARRWRSQGFVFLAPQLELCPKPAGSRKLPASAPARRASLSTTTGAARVPRLPLRAAVIMDQFTYECFRDECHLIQFGPDDWQARFETGQPDFLFVESAWHGNGDRWNLRPTHVEQLLPVLEWCRARHVPTVFWNKEDPPNFEHFIHLAGLFDRIFTTDADSIPRYRERVGHDRIRVLPFAAQPAIHNPIDSRRPRRGRLCFAGTYYREKYPERRREMDVLLNAARTRGLTIFDRNHGLDVLPQYRFPDELQPLIRGALPYEEMLRAYKDYDIFLNVNSVRDSPTMFARRVFELLACGTAVISTPSLGIERLLGREAVVIVEQEDEAAQWMDRLIADEHLRFQMVARGQRRVFSEHTYRHRLDTILSSIGLQQSTAPRRVAVVTVTSRPDRLANAAANYSRQRHAEREWLVVLHGDNMSAEDVRRQVAELPNVRVYQKPESWSRAACLNFAADQTACEYLARFDDDAYYGEHYLTDQLHAFLYCRTPLVGKGCHFAYSSAEQTLRLLCTDREHCYSDAVCAATWLVRRSLLEEVRFPERVERDADREFQQACVERGLRPYSTDRFNFIAGYLSDSRNSGRHSNQAERQPALEVPAADPCMYVTV